MSSIKKAMIMTGDDSSPDYANMPLTFVANEANSAIRFYKNGSYTPTIQYRTSTKGDWTNYTFNTVIPLTNIGDIVQFQNLTTKTQENWSATDNNRFESSGKVDVYGNILSMSNWETNLSGQYYCFANLFRGMTNLYSAENLYLGNSDTVAPIEMFHDTFNGCTNLVNPPVCPITSFNSKLVYQSTFANCSKLTSMPELPATVITQQCYISMFENCTSLTTVTNLLATTLANSCYESMFKGCTNLVTIPQSLPVTNLAGSCYKAMFYGCTSLTSGPVLPATGLAQNCYESMFKNCTSLKIPRELKARHLEVSCYESMFEGCTSLTSSPKLPATTLAKR